MAGCVDDWKNHSKLSDTKKLNIKSVNFFTLILLVSAVSLTAEPWQFSGDLEYAFEYNDNLCNLSNPDIEALLEGEDNFKLETEDDFINTPKLFLKAKSRLFGTIFSIGSTFRYSIHSRNPDKNFLYIRPRIKFTKHYITFTFAYTYIPEYTIRTYYDTDQPYGSDHYPWCTYALNRFTWQLNGRIWKKFEGKFRTDYELMYYNKHFLEYDSKALELEQALGYDSALELWAGFTYRKSEAQGIDVEGEDKITSDDSDISYQELQYKFSVAYDRIPLFGKDFKVGLNCGFYNREYTTEKAETDDPYHSAREESKISLDQYVQFEISRGLLLNLAYEYTMREAESSVFPEINELKDYSKNSIKLSISYNIAEFYLFN